MNNGSLPWTTIPVTSKWGRCNSSRYIDSIYVYVYVEETRNDPVGIPKKAYQQIGKIGKSWKIQVFLQQIQVFIQRIRKSIAKCYWNPRMVTKSKQWIGSEVSPMSRWGQTFLLVRWAVSGWIIHIFSLEKMARDGSKWGKKVGTIYGPHLLSRLWEPEGPLCPLHSKSWPLSISRTLEDPIAKHVSAGNSLFSLPLHQDWAIFC